MSNEDIDTSNDHLVGMQGDSLVIMRPVAGRIEKDRALRLAAWIVALAGEEEFKAVLKAVKNT